MTVEDMPAYVNEPTAWKCVDTNSGNRELSALYDTGKEYLK